MPEKPIPKPQFGQCVMDTPRSSIESAVNNLVAFNNGYGNETVSHRNAKGEYVPAAEIYGGAGGIRANFDDLAHIAEKLRPMSEDLQNMWGSATRSLANVTADTDALTNPDTIGAVVAYAQPLTLGPTSLLPVGLILEGLSHGVTISRKGYILADLLEGDGAVQHVLHGGPKVFLARLVGYLPNIVVLNIIAQLGPEGKSPALWENVPLDAEMTNEVAGLFWMQYYALESAYPGAGEAELAFLMNAAGLHDYPITSTSYVSNKEEKPPQNLADIMTDIKDIQQNQNSDKGLTEAKFIRVVGQDNKARWIVEIPGTELSQDNADNTRDFATNAMLMTKKKPEAMKAIEAELEKRMHDADDPIESTPVMLSGHSQGGIMAHRMASDQDFQKKFKVESVMVAGAPVGQFDVPPNAQVLALENKQDKVTSLDGMANPDESRRVTVRRDLLKAPREDAVQETLRGKDPCTGVLDPHGVETYVENARFVDESHNASLLRFKDSSSPFLNGKSATAFTVDLKRQVPASPNP